ncbi:putative methyltransferase-domain-containing protein [Cryomyces antarcticus]|uniref:25S rRNA adenine-N(1) methyltransferase n=1 Tax=Cryomyces antarcticus TaxID=329879 RepID=A0ABR0LWK0_9PEZI|nr:25S rRNA (adenine2142-N1)-methyltransferase [Cryomyces antarcticus]KAK5009796.1 25S rRNA (adenine2142-N1)-methyltransferase [Cryomyces antarcticus]KAK5171524.1 hypothetical protein LTR04_002415 [Oleoguttula sp. CCFEE 6159]KAK5252590.1 25S rRNA (adenine2142-N1)-methyltransferase [Cryomyces antarcticus]
MAVRKGKKAKSLAHGRPPVVRKPAASLSSTATRTLIRSHHQLQKAHAIALKRHDQSTAEAIRLQIEKQGGLQSYQQASIKGQSLDRGGDSSKVLMGWLASPEAKQHLGADRLKMLEIGALSKSNSCSRSGLFDVTRIDLHSQDEGILQQDFMERPLPSSSDDKFDIISLSLVLNYVPDAVGRGEMLRRTCAFLREIDVGCSPRDADAEAVFPSLFLVLPAPCITNSRYLDARRLASIMSALGYRLSKTKLSAKLAYSLWIYDAEAGPSKEKFEKTEVNPGRTRNNFSVILRPEEQG